MCKCFAFLTRTSEPKELFSFHLESGCSLGSSLELSVPDMDTINATEVKGARSRDWKAPGSPGLRLLAKLNSSSSTLHSLLLNCSEFRRLSGTLLKPPKRRCLSAVLHHSTPPPMRECTHFSPRNKHSNVLIAGILRSILTCKWENLYNASLGSQLGREMRQHFREISSNGSS